MLNQEGRAVGARNLRQEVITNDTSVQAAVAPAELNGVAFFAHDFAGLVDDGVAVRQGGVAMREHERMPLAVTSDPEDTGAGLVPLQDRNEQRFLSHTIGGRERCERRRRWCGGARRGCWGLVSTSCDDEQQRYGHCDTP